MAGLGLALGMSSMIVGAACAATPPPPAPFDAITWAATRSQAPVTALRMGGVVVRFEATTLDEVRKAVGTGTIAHAGDAGESLYWLCYTHRAGTRSERVWLVSHGEMGRSTHAVTHISAARAPTGGATADCPALPPRMTPLALDRGLWLGTSEQAATAALGAPSHRDRDWRSYDAAGKVPGDCGPAGLDRMSWLRLRLRNGRVDALSAGQTTSC